MFESAHPELLLNGAGVGLRVQAVHVVVHGAQLAGGNGGVAAEARLQDGVVDEDILLLQKTASSLRIYKAAVTTFVLCSTFISPKHILSICNSKY